jgi:peptide/nickel transport system ATP-binding protein
MTDSADIPLLHAEDLVRVYAKRGLREKFRAVDGVSLTIGVGETVALVGESGSGKSTLGRLAVGLERADEGSIRFLEHDLADLVGKGMRAVRPLRRDLQMVFQNSLQAMNPRQRVADVVAEPLVVQRISSRSAARAEVDRLLELVGLETAIARRRPTELSGGQLQRVGLARALITRPRLVVLDEPTSSLDVSVQAQALDLLIDLQRELGVAYLFITHDIDIARWVSHRTYVMRAGQIVESGPTSDVLQHPQDPYTQELLVSVLDIGTATATAPQRPPLTGELQ